MQKLLKQNQFQFLFVIKATSLKVICNVFHKIDEKVVSSCLLQYKPVCVINFDKLRCKNAKKKTFIGLF